MQRRWRIRRLVLAGLFVALAVSAYVYWPSGPRWRAECKEHNLLGFSVKHHVLLTSPHLTSDRVIHNAQLSLAPFLETVTARRKPEIYGFDLITGQHVFTFQVPKLDDSSVTSLSRSGQHLAIGNFLDHQVSVIDVISGETLFEVENVDMRNASFSDDDRFFMMVAGNILQVWNVQEKRRLASLTLESLQMDKVEHPQDRNWHNVKKNPSFSFSVSQDNRYLAFSWGYVLNVFDLPGMQLVGQASALGSPQFRPDGTLATIEHEYRPLKPVASLFAIKDRQLVRLKTDYTLEPKPHRVIAEGLTTYLTSQPGADRWQFPAWTPTWLSEKLTNWLSLSSTRWVLTLRSIETGRELLTKTIEQKQKRDARPRLVCGTAFSSMTQEQKDSYVELPPFNVIISPDNGWLAKVDSQSIELWPLLTWWRPWYCWVMVTGLAVGACYFIWYSRKGVATYLSGKFTQD